MKLSNVTFTGIDMYTPIGVLNSLSSRGITVEYGVLLSENLTGKDSKFPPWHKILDFEGLNLSAHICGKLARDVAKTGSFENVLKFMNGKESLFNRVQLNLGNIKFSADHLDIPDCFSQAIIQCNNSTISGYKLARTYDSRVACLIDNSGGRGRFSPFTYKVCADENIGFAGGLNVNNILLVLGYLSAINKDAEIWLDMESSLRSGDWFDVDKASRVVDMLSDIEEGLNALI